MNKFTMELVWHNCKINPPKESENDFLIVTNGTNVYEAYWYKKEGFSIHANLNDRLGWHKIDGDNSKWWWADIRQTVQNEPRFNGFEIDDFIEDIKNYIKNKYNIKI